MYKKIVIASFCLFLFASPLDSIAKEPQNLAIVKKQLIRYHDSGEYQKDQAHVINQAMEYLKIRLASEKKSPAKKKLAIVLDIDETSLSNYPNMLFMDFGGTIQDINDAEGKGNDLAIPATFELYRYAKANDVAIFFITGRTERYHTVTEKNLKEVGYKNWNNVTFKPEDYHEKTAAIYKTKIREQIERDGYDIVLNVGDQKSDLAGRHADKTFKLPNPYYIVP